MVYYNANAYDSMLGNIEHDALLVSAKCVAQCTGCMCNCKCSCSGGRITDFEWDEL